MNGYLRESLEQNKELKDLVASNPDLPIIFLSQSTDEEGYFLATNIKCSIGKVLFPDDTFVTKYDYIPQNKVYDDEDELREDIAEQLNLDGEYSKLSDSDFDALVDTIIRKYKPFWHRCIIVRVDID